MKLSRDAAGSDRPGRGALSQGRYKGRRWPPSTRRTGGRAAIGALERAGGAAAEVARWVGKKRTRVGESRRAARARSRPHEAAASIRGQQEGKLQRLESELEIVRADTQRLMAHVSEYHQRLKAAQKMVAATFWREGKADRVAEQELDALVAAEAAMRREAHLRQTEASSLEEAVADETERLDKAENGTADTTRPPNRR